MSDKQQWEDELATAMLGTDEGDLIDGSSEIPAGEMYRLAHNYVGFVLNRAWSEGHSAALHNVAWPKERVTNPYVGMSIL